MSQSSHSSYDTFNYSLRLFAFIILFAVVIISDIPFKSVFKEPIIQLYLAIACIIVIMLIDNITGFIVTLGLLTLYFRIYSEEIKIKKELEREAQAAKAAEEAKKASEAALANKDKNNNNKHTHTHTGDDKCTMDAPAVSSHKNILMSLDVSHMKSYITEENLLAAQTNIVDINNYNNEVEVGSGGRADTDRQTYSSQGLNNNNSHMRGYDINNVYLGSLKYDIL